MADFYIHHTHVGSDEQGDKGKIRRGKEIRESQQKKVIRNRAVGERRKRTVLVIGIIEILCVP